MVGRINPTIFDKLAASQATATETQMPAAEGGALLLADVAGFKQGVLRVDIERFGESALRANVRRELGWLLNTTNFESVQDLAGCPQVKSSVLNYGVADLAGKAQSRLAVNARAVHIREAVRRFEPRLDDSKLSVEAVPMRERENATTYIITGDIASAVEALRVQYFTDVESDTGNANVRE